MKKKLIYLCSAAIMMTSCSKKIDTLVANISNKGGESVPVVNGFVKYTIKQGEQYCDQNMYMKVSYDELKFIVKFDSSAIYKTKLSTNQNDINKLYGFSDNNGQHHQFSARFGWRYFQNALRLMAYVYNNNVMTFKEVGVAKVGQEHACAIKVSGSSYIFSMGDNTVTMPRSSTTPKAEGYKLYPYFGGDEMAPQTISIWIKELQ